MKYKKISWEQLEKDCFTLARKVKTKKIDQIVAISRGGLVQGRILSDLLNVPMLNIAMTFYKDLKRLDVPILTQPLPDGYTGKTVLLVDGVSDTGKTFQEALLYLRTLPIKKIYTAAPYIKPDTKFIPDFWVEKINGWIIFPYEVKETKRAFLKLYSTNEALNKLREVGLYDWEIEDE